MLRLREGEYSIQGEENVNKRRDKSLFLHRSYHYTSSTLCCTYLDYYDYGPLLHQDLNVALDYRS